TCTNLTLIKFNKVTVGFGIIKSAIPINKDAHPIKVIISNHDGSHKLWNNTFNSPITVAKRDDKIRNFSSFKSSNICFILAGLKVRITKNIIRYQPQNFAKKSDTSIIIVL